MKRSASTAFALLAACSGVAGAAAVQPLTAETFDSSITASPITITEFFAPWCKVCKEVAPIYEETAEAFAGTNVTFASVDCVEQKELCEKYRVPMFPTLMVFRGLDKRKPYKGPRTVVDMTEYMNRERRPDVSTVTKEQLEDFKRAEKVTVVAYLEDADDKSYEAFAKLSKSLREDYLFGVTTDAAAAKAEGISPPSIVLYKDFDEGKVVYDGKVDSDSHEDMQKFVNGASIPLIPDWNQENVPRLRRTQLPIAYVFTDSEESRDQHYAELTEVAKRFKGQIHIALIDAKQFSNMIPKLTLKEGILPALSLQDQDLRFPFDQTKNITGEAIDKMFTDFLSGELKPSWKSQPMPETVEGPVAVAVRDNFEQVVIDNDKDVLVEFYAPWCGHCKKLAPIYDELAELFAKHDKQVSIVKIDGSANDVEGHKVIGFPTLKLFPAGKKDSPVEHKGTRELEDLLKFIAENGTHKVDVSDASTIGQKVKDAAGRVVDAVTGGGAEKVEKAQHSEL